MKLSVRQFFGILCSFAAMLAVFFGVGSSIWVFSNEKSDYVSADEKTDPIRPNLVFGEADDSVVTDIKYYDVYFLAQNIMDLVKNCLILDEEVGEIDGKPNYKFKTSAEEDLHYHPESTTLSKDLRFGMFDYETAKPIYFKKFTSVEAITNAMLDQVGRPTSKCCDTHGYGLTFATWSVDPYPIYDRSAEHEDRYTDKGGHGTQDFIQMWGAYPHSGFEIAYFNSLLSIYDTDDEKNNKMIYINGKKTIFFYPLYTTGKDYYNAKTEGVKTNLRDCFEVVCVDENSDDVGKPHETFIYDELYTKLMTDEGDSFKNNGADLVNYNPKNEKPGESTSVKTMYRAYRLTNFLVDEDKVYNPTNATRRYVIQNDINTLNGAWSGEKQILSCNSENALPTNMILANLKKGRYNIYLFVKENVYVGVSQDTGGCKNVFAGFTDGEVGAIKEILKNQDVKVKMSFNADSSGLVQDEVSYNYGFLGLKKNYVQIFDNRDYLVVFEEKQEPRLAGASSGTLDYNEISDDESVRFTKHPSESGGESNTFDLRDISIDLEKASTNKIQYTKNYVGSDGKTHAVQLKVPSSYFSVQMSGDLGIIEQKLKIDSNPEDAPASYTYIDPDTKEVKTEPYKSQSLLMSIQEAIGMDRDVNTPEVEKPGAIKKIEVEKPDGSGFCTLEEYIDKGLAGVSGYTDYEQLISSLKLVRPRYSGVYNFFIKVNFGDNKDDPIGTIAQKPISIDLWAYRKHNIFVNIYDPEDFNSFSEPFDPNRLNSGEFIRSEALNKFSYRCENFYYLGTDLRFEDENQHSKSFLRNSELTDVPSGLEIQPGSTGQMIATLDDLMTYYEGKGKCLQDIVTGRYLTSENLESDPFLVSKNHIFLVVDKPNRLSA